MYACAAWSYPVVAYKSVVAAIDFTRAHKSIVGAVVAAVDITRTHISVVVVVVVVVSTVEIYQGAQCRCCFN